MRVVLDSNVLLAGIFTRGVCEQILDVCWKNAHTIVVITSEHILREFVEHAEKKFGVPSREITEVVDKLRRRVEMVEPVEVPSNACRDVDDLPVLGTAAAGKTDYLITGDRDLITLRSFEGISIISPREWLNSALQNG